jgi:hypothetical protein
MKTRRFIPHWLWIKYYTLLWCFRCYVWNPCLGRFVRAAERLFDQLDYQARIRSLPPKSKGNFKC